MREPIVSDNQYTWVQLDTEATFRRDQRSFHVFAEAYADVRGEIFNLRSGDVFSPVEDALSERLLVVTGLCGTLEARLPGRTLRLGSLSQLLVLPGVTFQLRALCDASVQIVSVVDSQPSVEAKPHGGRAPRYEAIDPVTQQQLREALARDDAHELQRVVLAVALHEPDVDRAFSICARLAEHADYGVRGNALLGLGHIARIHRRLDPRAQPLIEAGLRETPPWVRGQAHNAADDAEWFLGWKIARP